MSVTDDLKYMKRAMRLAEKGAGRVSPNPKVGAVIVKGGRIIGQGYHEYFGGPHAEVNAIRNASESLRGASLYVTVEPCNHTGKTPPCCPLILESGIREVITGMKDPNPGVQGGGLSFLKKKGVRIREGVLEKEIRVQNESFIKFITTGRPFFTLKSAMTLDGKIATTSGQSRWITSARSRLMVHRLRYNTDAVMVGINTVLKDDPVLRSKISRPVEHDPLKIVVDSKGRLPMESRVLTVNPQLLILAVTAQARENWMREIRRRGAQVLECRETGGRVDLQQLSEMLGGMEIANVMIEAGSTLAFSIISEAIADKALFFIAPKFIGGKNAPAAVGGEGFSLLDEAVKLKSWKARRVGEDLMVEGYF